MLSGALAAADWPHWRGAGRDGHTSEDSGWASGAWSSMPAVWSAEVGLGSTSPIVSQEKLYVMGWRDGRDFLRCLDAATGKEHWNQSYPSPEYGRYSKGDKQFYRGPTGTPELDLETGLIYALSVDGLLNCWDTRKQGRTVWSLNLYDRFEIPKRPQVTQYRRSYRDYGYTSAPLVHGGWLLVEAGDPKGGNLLAFDKRTGKLVWRSENKDPAGHTGGLVPMTVEGVPCVAAMTALNLVVTRLDKGHEGETVAAYPWITDFINTIATPAIHENHVLITSMYNQKAICKLTITLKGARKVWRQPHASEVCSPVIHDGHVYWANRGVQCLSFDSGKRLWSGGKVGAAASCIVTGDDRLIVWANDGDLALLETAERSVGEFKQLALHRDVLKDMAWPHVVLSGGRLYCKDRGGRIKCLSLTGGSQ
jgi:outer membrane protein assembly factor BamB